MKFEGGHARIIGHLGHIQLDRPEKLNALNGPLVAGLIRTLITWEQESQVRAVMIESRGDRAFCAGGDIEQTHAWLSGRQRDAEAFWKDEHYLVLLIASYGKPVVTFMHGFVLGGGVGLGCHASHRLLTADAQVGMPEVAIGLAPDVGGLYLLARAPHCLGFYLGLTAHRAHAHDALLCGFADAVVRSEGRQQILQDLADGVPVDQAVVRILAAETEATADAHWLRDAAPWIEACFCQPTVDGILTALDGRPEADAHRTAQRIRAMAPLAVRVTHRAMQSARGQGWTLPQTLVGDVRRNVHFSHGADLREGIRAMVIDGDHAPAWSPAALADVSPDAVAAYFRPFDGADLDLQAVSQRRWP